MISIRSLLFSCCLSVGFKSMGQQPVSKAHQQPYSLLLTVKLHSTGHSTYSGQYLNHNPNAEVGLSYKRKIGGAFITKNTDVSDVHSSINYTTVGLFKSFRLAKSLQLISYVGYFLRQSHSFADHQSDAWSCVVLKYAINEILTIESTTLVGNLIRHHSKAFFANRLNVTVSLGKFKVDGYAWYSQAIKSAPHFVSASIAVTTPDWVLSPSVSARVQLAMLQNVSNKKPEGAMQRGGLISLIIPINFKTDRTDSQPTDLPRNN